VELTLSTHLLVDGLLDDAGLDALAVSGYPVVEAWLAEPHVPWKDTRALGKFSARLESRGLRAGSVHLPFYPSVPELRGHGAKWSLIDSATKGRKDALEGATEGLHAAATLGASCAVLHLGWQKDAWDGDQGRWAAEGVASLLETARQVGVTLLLENIISEGTRAARLVSLLDEVDPERAAGVCLDLGHAHVEGDVLAQLEAALPRLRHLHIHDNDGHKDAHLPPGEGSIPWESVLGRLQEFGYQGLAALELRDLSRGDTPSTQVVEDLTSRARVFHHHFSSLGLLPPCPTSPTPKPS